MHNFTATYTDQYQLAMAQVYFQNGHRESPAVFDYFFRKLPFNNGYAIFAGLEDFLEILENLTFSDSDIAYLKTREFPEDFIEYLRNFKFRGTIFSAKEGDLVFPTRPVLQVEATMIEAQLIETILLNLLNFQTLIATKASRMRLVAGDRKLLDFGLRRAQGPGGFYASRAAIIGGFDGTSNVVAGKEFNIPVAGTMAHSFIQSYEDEISAFRAFAKGRPHDCVLLVDSYDTLKSGLPNAIKIGKEMEEKGQKLGGIRLDSGDLAYLARESRRMLDEAGLNYVKIAASNQLDEFVIKSLLEQKAPIDLFGVGTNLVTGSPDAALDGVYKLAASGGKPRLKISESLSKVTIPHKKQVYRLSNSKGELIGADAITLREETTIDWMHDPRETLKSLAVDGYAMEALLHPVMVDGKRTQPTRSLEEIAFYAKERLETLPGEYKRFFNPHIYKVGMSSKLKTEREELLFKYRM